MQVICPLLNVQGDANSCVAGTALNPTPVNPQPSATDAVVDAATGPESVVNQETQTGSFEEGFIQIKNTRIYGIRTFSIILIIVVVYSYLCIKNNDALGMKDLALMACGFLFGIKSISKSR